MTNEHTNTRTPRTAEQLRTQLVAERAIVAVRDEHQLAQRTHGAEHRIALDDLGERVANAKRSRRERYRDARDSVSLADLYRKANEAGTRAYIRSQINGSAEMRTLRIVMVRRVSLLVGIPVLLAFAAWSTSGVQAGMVRLLHLETGSFAWAASWSVEPAIITVVAMIIIGRAVLRSSGGDIDWRAQTIEAIGLGLSLVLNIVGGWPDGTHWDGAVTAIPHAIGPIGCAATAYLIGLFDGYVASAEPWANAPKLKDLELVIAQPNATNTLANIEHLANTDVREAVEAPHTHDRTPANEQPAIAGQPHDAEQVDTAEIFRLTNTTRHTNATRRTANGTTIDPQVIERLDAEMPNWRTNIPSARALASLLGYASSSTGNNIRRRLLVLVDEQTDEH